MYIALLVAAFVAAAIGVWALTEGDDGGGEKPAPSIPAAADPPAGGQTPTESPGDEPAADGGGASAQDRRERMVERAVLRYVEAVDDRDGTRLCGLVQGIADLDLPVRRPSCTESVSESIGYRDPRGFPVFESAVVSGAPQVQAGADRARVTVTVVTEFADRDEPSIEDDVVYFELRGGEWVVAKPSSTLYRSIGVSDVPPDVLEPPGTG